jgi:hypothetical protein
MSPDGVTMSLMTTATAGNTHSEVLPPTLTKGEARSLDTSAKRHWRAASRNALVFAAELRRLHGGAHLVRGYNNFAIYAEHTFDGLTANAAKQLSRQGGVLLTLEHRNRIDLEQPRLPVATTALRALSVVHNTFGERTMLSAYDRATRLRPDRAIVEQTVKNAMRDLDKVAPTRPALPGLAPPDPDAGSDSDPEDLDDLDDELPSQEISDLVDRLDILRRHLNDLRLNVEDPIVARRELRNIEEEICQVKAAITPRIRGRPTIEPRPRRTDGDSRARAARRSARPTCASPPRTPDRQPGRPRARGNSSLPPGLRHPAETTVADVETTRKDIARCGADHIGSAPSRCRQRASAVRGGLE